MQFYIQTCPPHLIPRVRGGEGFLKQKKQKKQKKMVHLSTPLPRSEGALLTSQPYDNPSDLVQIHHMPHHNNRPCAPLNLILQHLLNMLRCYILALIHKQTTQLLDINYDIVTYEVRNTLHSSSPLLRPLKKRA